MLPPFVLYIIPFLVLRELWKASDPTDPNDTEGWRRSADNPLHLGVARAVRDRPDRPVAVLGRVVPRRWPVLAEASNRWPTASTNSTPFGVVTAAVNVAAAVVWIVLVRQLTARHVRLTSER